MNFGTLKTRIQDVLGRTPNDVVYELVTSDVNNAIRVRSLEKKVTRQVANEVLLPTDFKSAISVKRGDVELTPAALTSVVFEQEGTPMRYAVSEKYMHLAPKPEVSVYFDGTMTIGASGSREGWQSGVFGAVTPTPPDLTQIDTNSGLGLKSVVVKATRDLGTSVYAAVDAQTPVELPYSSVSGGVYTYQQIGGGAVAFRDYIEARTGQDVLVSVSSSASITPAGGDLTIRYHERLGDLSADTDTNDILTNYPQIYVYGALFHHHSLTQNAEAAQGYYQLYERAMNEAKKENNAALFGAGPVVPKVRSAP